MVGRMRWIAVVALAATLFACSGESGVEDVPWTQYAPQVRERLEAAVESGDCQRLGEEFIAADEGSDAHRAKYGEGNGDLMAYIDDSMEMAGCQ